MQPGKAFLGGVLGGAAATLITALGRGVGIPVNIEMLLGSMFTAEIGALTWILGFVVHLFVSGLVGLVYGLVFEHVVRTAGAGPGMLLSSIHLLIAGIAVGSIHHLHPLIPEMLMHPGGFFINLGGFGVLSFVLLHVLFGAIVGAVYQPVRFEHRREAHV